MSRLWCVYSDEYFVDMGDHVFPVAKYRLVHARLREEGTVPEEAVAAPQPATEEQLRRAHTARYLSELRRLAEPGWGYVTGDTPISPDILAKAILGAGGTILTCELALQRGVGLHLSGGFHHAGPDSGEGFCYVNDAAVAIRELQARGRANGRLAIGRAAVVDLDVHQGNGTARIFAGDDTVFTFSMHEEWNYPPVKPPSDWDIGLPSGCEDDTYLAHLERALPEVLSRGRPGLVVYLAGADPYERDQLGGLALTLEGLRERDALVLGACRERGVPVAILLAGGYAEDTADTVEIHVQTAREARRCLDATRAAAPVA